MPHKMNTRSCERVNGLQVVLRGYASMAAELAGAQWNEGDVFCSVVRRVALPDAFFAIDGQIETFLTVLDEFGAYPAVIQRELDRYLPFLATTRILIAAVRAGVGRETAHEVIKEHAVAVALAMREKGLEPDLLDRLAADPAVAARPAWRWTRRWRTSRRSPAPRVIRSTAWSPRSTSWSAAIPRRPSTPRARSCDVVVGASPRSTSPIWTISPTASRTSCSRCIVAKRPSTGTNRPSNTPDGEGFWSVATTRKPLRCFVIR